MERIFGETEKYLKAQILKRDELKKKLGDRWRAYERDR